MAIVPSSSGGQALSLIPDSSSMKKSPQPRPVTDGAHCKVIGGVHVGKSGTVRDIKTGKTGFVSITVVQANGERFKTLAKNVVIT